MKNSFKAEIVNVDAKVANSCLERNNINRPLRPSLVTKYRRTMETGNWVMNGETVIVSTTGDLLNGQHRLTAASKLKNGETVPMLFVFGIPNETFSTIDAGIVRTAGDAIYIEKGYGVKFCDTLAAGIKANVLHRMAGNTKWGNSLIQSEVTASKVLEELEKDPLYLECATFLDGFKTKPRISPGRLLYLTYRFFSIDREFTEEWLPGFITGANLPEEDYRLWVINRLQNNLTSKEKLPVQEKGYFLIQAWNWARTGKKIKAKASLRGGIEVNKHITLPTDLKRD